MINEVNWNLVLEIILVVMLAKKQHDLMATRYVNNKLREDLWEFLQHAEQEIKNLKEDNSDE